MPDTPRPSSTTRHIARNTGLLYLRSVFVLLVQLYLTRATLRFLGLTDFGLYGVAASVLGFFSFINSAMVSSTQRYLNFAMGRDDFARLHLVFNTALRIHSLIAVVLFAVAETLGLFFVFRMQIPEGRLFAVLWVYHCSILTFLLQVTSFPFNAAIVSHERMGVFAVFSIVQVLLQLFALWGLMFAPFDFDHLIAYATAQFLIQLSMRIAYSVYCHRHFPETHLYRGLFDRSLFRSMTSFAVWNLWGNMAVGFSSAGVDYLLNRYFGPLLNAANKTTHEVRRAINNLSANFLSAVSPQLTKQYAVGNIPYLHSLIFGACRFSLFLLFLLILPVFFHAEPLLRIWLGEYPAYAPTFIRLTLLSLLFQSSSNPLVITAQATGRIKVYQVVIGGILLLEIPISWFCLSQGCPPPTVFVVNLAMVVSVYGIRILFLRHMVSLSLRRFLRRVTLPALIVGLPSALATYGFSRTFPADFWGTLASCTLSVLLIGGCILLLGLSASERAMLYHTLRSRLLKRK